MYCDAAWKVYSSQSLNPARTSKQYEMRKAQHLPPQLGETCVLGPKCFFPTRELSQLVFLLRYPCRNAIVFTFHEIIFFFVEHVLVVFCQIKSKKTENSTFRSSRWMILAWSSAARECVSIVTSPFEFSCWVVCPATEINFEITNSFSSYEKRRGKYRGLAVYAILHSVYIK